MNPYVIVAFAALYGVTAYQNLRRPSILNQRDVLRSAILNAPEMTSRRNFGSPQDLLQVIPIARYAVSPVKFTGTGVQTPAVQRGGGYPSAVVKEAVYQRLWQILNNVEGQVGMQC